MQHLFQPRVIGIAGAVHVAPGGGAHVAALAGQPGPAALGRRDHAVEGAERVEHAVVAIELAHRAVLRRHRARSIPDRRCRRAPRWRRVRRRRRTARPRTKTRHDCRGAACRSAARARKGRAAARGFSACGSSGRGGGGRRPAPSVLRSSFRLCGASSSTERAMVAEQRRIIPGGQPGGDIADIASHAAQRRDHRVDRGLADIRWCACCRKSALPRC